MPKSKRRKSRRGSHQPQTNPRNHPQGTKLPSPISSEGACECFAYVIPIGSKRPTPAPEPVASPANINPAHLTGVGARFGGAAYAAPQPGPSNTAARQGLQQSTSATPSVTPISVFEEAQCQQCHCSEPAASDVPQCPLCPEVPLSTVSVSRRHMKKHDPNTLLFSCAAPGCKRDGKGFVRKDDLNRHLRKCPANRRLQENNDAPPFAHTGHYEQPDASTVQPERDVQDLEQTMMRTHHVQSPQAPAHILENLELCKQLQMAAAIQRAKAWEDYCLWDRACNAWTPNIVFWDGLSRKNIQNESL